MGNLLSGLYYPFSRSINQSSLKQLLLVFESIAFLDPVDADAWRARLFHDLETDDPRFKKYRDVHAALPTLMAEGAITRSDPQQLAVTDRQSTAASALSDLMDEEWTRVASNPRAFGLSYGAAAPDGTPLWQMFKPKIPTAFVEALHSSPALRQHLVREGREGEAWTLSYEAGSAAATSVHLAAAEALGLAPVTDSAMHHQLLLRKLARTSARSADKSRPLSSEVILHLTHKTAISMVDEILPQQKLELLDFEDILRFREATHQLRHQAVTDISQRLEVVNRVPDSEELVAVSKEIETGLRRELRAYRTELTATRDRLWPQLIGSMAGSLAPGSVAAVAMNYIGGPGHALAASITAAALALLKGSLELRAEHRKIQNSTAPAVAYLSRLGDLC